MEKYFLTARYGAFLPDYDLGANDLTRISLGAGWILAEGVELRIEQQINRESETELEII